MEQNYYSKDFAVMRHGNAANIFEGQNLTPLGKEQAQHAGLLLLEMLKKNNYSKIKFAVSERIRTKQTAEECLKSIQKSLSIDSEIIEFEWLNLYKCKINKDNIQSIEEVNCFLVVISHEPDVSNFIFGNPKNEINYCEIFGYHFQ